jgi:hypothetical protein
MLPSTYQQTKYDTVTITGARGGVVVEALRYKRKVAGSISYGVTGFLHWHNLSGRTMALGSAQPLTKMNTRNISWGKGGRCVGPTTLPPSCADYLKIWNPQGLSRPVMGLLYLLPVSITATYATMRSPYFTEYNYTAITIWGKCPSFCRWQRKFRNLNPILYIVTTFKDKLSISLFYGRSLLMWRTTRWHDTKFAYLLFMSRELGRSNSGMKTQTKGARK